MRHHLYKSGRGRPRRAVKRGRAEKEVQPTEGQHTGEPSLPSPNQILAQDELIEISSSHHDSERTHSARGDVITQPMEVNGPHANASDHNSALEQMTAAVTNLASMFMGQTPPVFRVFSPLTPHFYKPLGSVDTNQHVMPSIVYAMPPTMSSSINDQDATEVIMQKLDSEKKKTNVDSGAKVSLGSASGLKLGRKLFSPKNKDSSKGSPCEYYINNRSPSSVKIPRKKAGKSIPLWVPMLFRPPQWMHLNDDEVAVATFVFGPYMCEEYRKKEVLVETNTCHATRDVIGTLIPKEPIDQSVLDLLACMLTHEERATTKCSHHWFLPTTFSQLVLNWHHSPPSMKDFYANEFMGKIETVSKIFIPINEDNVHWYLMVIELERQHIVLLDSKPCIPMKQSRRLAVRTMACFVEAMLLDNSFYEFKVTHKPVISEFPLIEPASLGEQQDGSNDCGLWVATWMRDCAWSDTYIIHVNDSSRMRLALDLVTKPFNKRKVAVIETARAYLRGLEDKQKRLVSG